jgi:hypothetical protein
MLISFEYKFIFLKTFKTASTTTDVYFEQYCADNLTEQRERLETISEKGIIGARKFKKLFREEDLKYINHQPAKKLKRNIGDDIFNSYYKFCNVRNPFDLVVSNYFYYRKNKDLTFDEFILDSSNLEKIKKRDSKIYKINNSIIIDDFIRYENLQEDIDRISSHLKLPVSNRTLGHYVASKRRYTDDYMSLYNETTESIVRESFKEYIEYFGY